MYGQFYVKKSKLTNTYDYMSIICLMFMYLRKTNIIIQILERYCETPKRRIGFMLNDVTLNVKILNCSFLERKN